MESLEDIVNRCKGRKNKEKETKSHSGITTKLLLSIIFVFSSLIYMKISPDNKAFYKENVFTNSYSFVTFNNLYEKYFGEVVPTFSNEELVFSNELNYTNIESYEDGEVLTTSVSNPVSNITGGIVVFIGEKDMYGNTVIVQGNDGYDIWYGNLTNVNVSLYDYLETETILGETETENLYLVIKKDNKFIKYEDYKN